MGYGIIDCGIPVGDDPFVLATCSELGDAICEDIERLTKGISEYSCHAAFSMAFYSCMHRADFLVGALPRKLVKHLVQKVDQKLKWAFATSFGSDLLATFI